MSEAPSGGEGARYLLKSEIGRGSFGRVLLGIDRDLRRSVAIKLLPEELTGSREDVQAFLEEAIITGGLEHPNIVPAYELGFSEELGLYYTMKRLAGRTLRDVLENERPALSRRVAMFVEMCRAIAYAHSRGVIHTDLKPENVLIGDHGEVVVADWGLAQVLGPEGRTQARAKMHTGTPLYMSPEHVTEQATALDGRTDVWALGAIFYELLTGRVPFGGSTADEVLENVLEAPLTVPSEIDPSLSPALDDICRRALEKDRERRYGSVTQLLADVDAFLEGRREQSRRQELAGRSAEMARGLLEDLASAESSDDRARLLDGYRRTVSLLERGFDAQPTDTLMQIAGDLYWRIFIRVLPVYADESIEILGRLSRRALSAIVRAGRNVTDKPPGHDDPWLSVVLSLAERGDLDGAPVAMKALVDRIKALKSVPLFEQMAACDLLPIAEVSREVTLEPSEIVFLRGDAGTALYVLVQGEVEVLLDDTVVNRLRPGDVFGEIAVLGGAERTATIRASTACTCVRLDGSDFRRIVRENGDIGWGVIQVLSGRLHAATEREQVLRSER